MRFREMSIQEISCSEELCKDLSYSHVTVTAGGVGAQLFRRRYASVVQIRPSFLQSPWANALSPAF